jgi:hypothetical protein
MGRPGAPGWRETRVTGDGHEPMSAFGGKADIDLTLCDVRFFFLPLSFSPGSCARVVVGEPLVEPLLNALENRDLLR